MTNRAPPSGDRSFLVEDLVSLDDVAVKELLAVLPVAVCICDATGTITSYNERAVELWGRDPGLEGPPDLFCGSLALFHRDGTPMPHAESPMAETLETGVSVTNREIAIDRPDGTRVCASVSVAPLRDKDGTRIGAVNCFHDVTELRKAEEAVRRLAPLPELNPTPVIEIDLTGRPRYLNPAASREFPEMESLGAGHPLLRQILDRIAEDDPASHCVGEATLGEKIYEWRVGRFPEEDRIIVHVGDITPHRQALEALGTSTRRFRALLEHAADAIFVIGPDGRVLDVNAQACRSLGYTEEELRTMSVLDFDPGTSVDLVDEIWALVNRGESFTGEAIHRRKDGRTFPVEISVGLIETEADPVMLALARDITARRRLEAERRQGQRLEAIGQLAGGIAHDFNNILTVILGSVDLLRQTGSIPEPAREIAEDISEASERAARLTQQLLAFSRRQILTFEVLDINTVVRELATLLHRLLGETIDVQTTLATDLDAVEVDRGQLEQVVTNLAVNARDAMPKGGVLRITTANVTLGPDDAVVDAPPGPHVSLTVSDTGMGMSPEVLSRIFEPFFTTKEKGRGTGLGLATVYGIVAQSNGHITVESEPGEGTTFTVYFPRVTTSAPSDPSPRSPELAPGGAETILVVEDEAAVRKLICRVLDDHGYTVLVASDGQEALDLARRHEGQIDLLLSDVVMPGMSGRDLAEHLLHLSPRTRVAFLSGYTDDEVLRHGVLDARFPFLQKPFTPDVLARKVRDVLDPP
ncbi:MAG: PAS domain S-box protein [Longimicrobiales bacterium]|nr:PAS domain S-box protein [Longimicrobiales bacterium]